MGGVGVALAQVSVLALVRGVGGSAGTGGVGVALAQVLVLASESSALA